MECRKCKLEKGDHFHKNEDRCKDCMNAKSKKWKAKNKDMISKYNKKYASEHVDELSQREKSRWQNDRENQSDRHKMWRYNLSKEELQKLKDQADGKCAICKKESKLYIDHDHETGNVRELLCITCNTTLGKFNDNTKLLQKLIDYLRKHNPCSCSNDTIALCYYGF